MALGRHGVAFINKCRQQFGNSFSLSLAGVRMTFLFEPAHIDYFFGAPDSKVTFRPAVEQFTQRVFGLTSRLFFPLHFKMLTELRHLLVPASISQHMQALGSRALALLPCYVHHPQVDLYCLCRGLVFHCAVEELFGARFMAAVAAGELEPQPQAGRAGGGGRGGEGGGGRAARGRGEGGASPSPATCSVDESESEREADQQRQGRPGASTWMPYPWLPQWAGGAGGGGADGGARGKAAAAQAPAPLQRPPEGVHRLARDFFAFEDGFELAASPVPHAFQPEFTAARRRLLAALAAADGRGLFGGTPAGQLLERTEGLPAALRPNLLLAVLWASQANTVPSTFWATGFLLLPENAHHRAAVLAELQAELKGAGAAAAASSPGGGSAAYSNEELVAAAARVAAGRRSAVSRCVAEALRLRVQSIDVRLAADTLELPLGPATGAAGAGVGKAGKGGKGDQGGGGVLRLPRGRLLAVCPFVSHHDPLLYGGPAAAAAAATGAAAAGDVSSPWAFNPDRPELKLGDGTAVVSSVAGLAFGGGPYRCPGRFFAEQELGLLVQLLLWTYDMQLSYTADGRPAGLAAGSGGSGGTPAGADAAAGDAAAGSAGRSGRAAAPLSPGGTQQPQPDHHALSPAAAAAASRAAAAAALAAVPPQPQLRQAAGGSWLYGVLSGLVGARALAWGCGWFDGVDGPLEDFRHSGDPGGLLPPCDLKRLVGVKVPRKPLWVQLGVPHWQARRLGLVGVAAAAASSRRWADIIELA
ncbi:hypothetical protein HXX76_015571 [Chlamydomonas incerta]|uniref:Cytochrome P450 n=1 Tax=Chlamydomonas incerta TaxID=51695 RepID=A0A835VPM2_CHLIN|nr:hypothetical protein HXX76_015571 [Chlamydomonas incerta]|eukprot:KAG2423055.1 hypothetical protein HXX76_015571 [Chlamydomonas incerta]